MWLSRAARLVVVISAACAIGAAAFLGSALQPSLMAWTLGAFLLTLVAAVLRPKVAPALVLLPSCLLPAIIREWVGVYDPAHVSIWLSAMLGGIVGSSRARAWSLPGWWGPHLAHGALSIALVWAVVAAREFDWTLRFLYDDSVWVTAQGVSPRVAVVWVCYVSASAMIGVLWLDALFAQYREASSEEFGRRVTQWLAVSAFIGALVAVVQMSWAMSWMNAGSFAFLRRASGLLLDANAFGMTAAIGGAIALVLGVQTVRWYGAIGWGLVAALCWVAVWGSGSRTSLLVVVMAGAAAAASLVFAAVTCRRSRAIVLVVVAAAGSLAFAVAVWAPSTEAVGPLARVTAWLDDPSRTRTLRGTLVELWNRDGYGLAAASMIGHFPWTGVGPGMFHLMVLDYTSMIHYPIRLPTDNAQNWLRHHVAETGVLGSIGWAMWAALFVGWVVRSRVWRRPAGAVLSATLAGVAAVSLVSMPTQNPAVLLIAATLVFWLWSLSGHEAISPASSPRAWIVVWIGALAFAGATLWIARSDLRLPERAIRAGWTYHAGYHGLETTPDRPFRWTKPRATVAFAAPRGYLRLGYSIQHENLSADPVRVRFWWDGELIIDETVADNQLRTAYLLVGGGRNGVILDSEVNRPFMDHGRELGVAIQDWEVVMQPPDGARVFR